MHSFFRLFSQPIRIFSLARAGPLSFLAQNKIWVLKEAQGPP